MRILFTGGGGAGSEAIWRMLFKKHELFFADANLDSINSIIPVECRILIPMANKENFVSEIKRISSEKNIDLIVPGVDEELLQLSESRGNNMPEIFLPSTEFVSLMLDKLECAKSIASAGLSVPKTELLVNGNSIKFPKIIKPRSGRGSRGVSVVESMEEIDAYRILYKASPEKTITQELGVGDEYTILVAGDKFGKLRAIVPVKVYQKKGITIRAKTELNNNIIKYVKSFHEAFKPSYIYNIQCILTKNGIVLPFEVNPRVSTTFCLSLAAGFDPFAEYDQTNNDDIFLPHDDYFLNRNWSNEISKI